MQRVAPPDHLADTIDGYTFYDDRSRAPHSRRELPHTDAVMIVNLGQPIRVSGGDGASIELGAGTAFIAGAHLRPAISSAFGSQQGVHIHLSLPSLRRLLGVPLTEFTDRVVPLDAILPSEIRTQVARIGDGGLDAQLACLDHALTTLLRNRPPIDPQQTHALRLLTSKQAMDIAEIARDIGWSRKHLAERTRDAIGIGPRSYRRLLRFHRVTRILSLHAAPNLADLADVAGYCDQPHMNREFREFAGLTPREFIARSLPNGGGLVEA